MNPKVFALTVFVISNLAVSAIPNTLDVSHSSFAFQLSEKQNLVEYKTRYVKGKINTAKCEKNFLKDIWLVYGFKKNNLKPVEKSDRKNKNYIQVKEDQKTFFVAQTSELGLFLRRMPDTLFNLNLREQRLCKK